MSVNMDKFDSRDVDYADFEYQQVEFTITIDEAEAQGEGDNVSAYMNQDVLESSGGLDQNEVAELVTVHRSVLIEPDAFEDQAPETQGNFEFRGVMGNDLTASADRILGADAENDAGDSKVYDTSDGFSEDDVTFRNKGQTNAAIFDHFDLVNGAGFEAPGDGSGAGASSQTLEKTLQFRDWYGAGPILDASDSIGINANVVVENVDIGQVSGVYRATFVWDIAEVSDAGRRFGIPGR